MQPGCTYSPPCPGSTAAPPSGPDLLLPTRPLQPDDRPRCCHPAKQARAKGALLWALLLMAAPQAAAQAPPAPAPAASAAAQKVEIRGSRAQDAPTEPVRILQGDNLSNRVDSTLGATLQNELGTANASFGPNVGLPLIRGQGGSRVRAMVDGLGTHDASTVSADHGVMLEPGLAERITVWRGPATIRFGGGAIGGAVEVDEGRVPSQPRDKVELRTAARVGSGDSRLGILRLDGPWGAHLAWHADLHARQQGLTPIPGRAIDEDAVRRQFQLVNAVNTDGFIDNTQAVTEGGAVGLGAVAADGFLGVAASRLRQVYGIPPGGHSHNHTPAPGQTAPPGGPVRLRAQQDRLSLQGETAWPAAWLPAGAGPATLRVKAAHVRYGHAEYEGERLGTTFSNDVDEVRAEFEHRWGRHGSAVWGLQAQQRVFSALGAEAFVPRTHIRGGALFTVQRWTPSPWTLELGLRADWQRLEPGDGFEVLGQPRSFPARRFWPRSLSLALQRAYGQGSGNGETMAASGTTARRGSVTLTHWQVGRAPDVQELYAAGPHLATRSFDFGNSALGLETLHAWDLAWVHREGPWLLKGNAFAYRSANYIYQRSLGWFYEAEEGQPQAVCARLDSCLPATKREQAAARFHGYEAELSYTLQAAGAQWKVGVFSDLVRGRLVQLQQDVPRLPPQRYGVSLEGSWPAWSAQARLTRGRAQNRPGENETPTAAYARLDVSLRWHRPADDGARPLSLFVVARNLGNRDIRNSSSFLRNYAPEPGRSIEIGMELSL